MVAKNEHVVVIVGGGPTGLMVAAELALAGVDAAVVERRETQHLSGDRARGLHSRSIEVLDQRGVAERFLAAGYTSPGVGFALNQLDLSDFPTRHPYVLALLQRHVERILAEWVSELGVPCYRGCDVIGFAQDESGVDIEVSSGGSLRAQYLVGCDGGRSFVRKHAGIEFPGHDPSTSFLLAEVATTEEPPYELRRVAAGIRALSKLEDGVHFGVLIEQPPAGGSDDPTLGDLREALIAEYGTGFGAHDPIWITRFTDMTRQAAAYRERRVLLAGDAAHIHSPAGGQGLNTGMQDAVNLGWKLAQVVQGTSPESLLDTYHAERHPVAARVLRNTMAQTALNRGDDRMGALNEMVSEFLAMDEPRRRIAGMISALDVHYDLGEGHPLLGRRMPDLDLVTDAGPVRVFALLHEARAVVVNFGTAGALEIDGWGDRVRFVDARTEGVWELPVIGEVAAPSGVLIRPDGHVAWVGDGTDVGLRDALEMWCGAPAVRA